MNPSLPLATEPFPQPSQPLPNYMPQLDALRGLAVLSVLFFHFIPQYLNNSPLGWIGVRLFFVLSGFLITGILLRGRDLTRPGARLDSTAIIPPQPGPPPLGGGEGGAQPALAQAAILPLPRRGGEGRGEGTAFVLRQFYARRFLRIFPIYYTVLIGLAIFGAEDVRPNFFWHLCYLSNVRFVMDGYYHLWVAHFWSLSVEEQFYLLWPAVVLFTPRKWLVPVIGVAIATGPAYRLAALIFGFSGPACEVLLPACLDTLGTGAMLAVLLHQPGAWPTHRKAFAIVGWVGFTTFILFNVLDYFHLARATGFVAGDFLLALFAAGLIAHAAYGCTGWGRWLLETKPLVYVGAISYGLYVYHEIVTGVINWLTQSGAIRLAPWTVIGLRFGATFLVAALSWRFFEKPINNLKRFFPYPA